MVGARVVAWSVQLVGSTVGPLGGHLPSGSLDPGISPNEVGLPGLPVVRSIVGALLTWGLVACVAGLVVSVMVWALAHQQGNYQYASSGKSGVMVSAGGALLIGAANAIVTFFSGLGAGV